MSQAHAKRTLTAIQHAHNRGLASVVTLERSGKKGEYDPSTGITKPDEPPQVFESVGLKDGYRQSDIDGTLIKQGDQRLHVAAEEFIRPKSNERIKVGEVTYIVQDVGVVAPGDADILYTLQIRGL